MYLLLTDLLACPRCGPGFGLILLAREVDDRRVREGDLGCANCRDRFPIRSAVADLRPPPRTPVTDETMSGAEEPDAIAVEGLAAALGVGAGSGVTLLLGDAASWAGDVARAAPEIEVVAAGPRVVSAEAERVSRVRISDALPFFTGRIRGVALDGDAASGRWLPEAARVLAPRHRVVVLDPPDDARERFAAVGLETVVEGPGMLVASR